jgi:hypothetical protein
MNEQMDSSARESAAMKDFATSTMNMASKA